MQYIFPYTKPPRNDIPMRSRLNEIMNTITRKYYGFTLVTCPDCGTITPRHDDKKHKCTNPSCAISFRASDAPDLFF